VLKKYEKAVEDADIYTLLCNIFSSMDYKKIFADIKSTNAPLEIDIINALTYACPKSLEDTHYRFHHEFNFTLEEVLASDKAYAKELIFHKNFEEGVRALLIDRDRNPKWV
jgi:enoyl-CoA hydratase/carnithine racemase